MEQLISRRLPARKAQSGVALIMVLIMLTAMAIAGVALVRVVDSANVISGNFAFRQSTLNIADLGVEAATADLIAIHAGPATARENAWHPTVAATARRLPLLSCQVRSVCPTWMATPRFQYWAIRQGCRSGATERPSSMERERRTLDGNDVPGAPRGYNGVTPFVTSSTGSVIVAPVVDVLDDCSNLPLR
jgi:Tfp pilus assembly protein PilX